MEIDKCNICSNSVETYFSLENKDIIGMAKSYIHKIAVCKNCGFIFTKNPFNSEKLYNRYAKFSKFEFDSEDYFLDDSEDYIIRSKNQYNFISQSMDLLKITSILEFGAASGYNLSLYNDHDRIVNGVEPSNKNCKLAKMKYDIDLFCGIDSMFWDNYSKIRGENFKYDLVFLSHTLEHIVNPMDFMKKVSKINEGYVFIEVPTMDVKFSNEAFGMFCEEHVNIFTLESLQNMMVKIGYKLINANIILNPQTKLNAGFPSIATLWKKTCNTKKYFLVNSSIDIFWKYIEDSKQILDRLKNIIDNIDNDDRLAIWGTGHHLSMLLANTNLEQKNIVRVYDSDTRKQGMEICNCNIQCFNSDDIINHKVDTILIATYTAQEAIYKYLKPYCKSVNIILLYK